MASLQDLIAWRDRLQAAVANEAREVEDQSGERVVYKSTAETLSALRYVEGLIAAASKPVPSQIRFSTSKGL